MMGDLFARAGILFGGMGVLLLVLLSGGNHAPTESVQIIPIAYAMVENPETVQCLEGPCRTGIALIDPLTGEIETFRVGAVYPETLHYSPDYSMISYNIGTRLYVLDLETRRTRLITNEYLIFILYRVSVWSPDSSQIVFTTTSGIEILNLTTNERHIISHIVPRNNIQWSPDGTQLLISGSPTRAYSNNSSLFSIDVTTGEHINLTQRMPYVFFGTWSPDSTQVVFVAGFGRNFYLFTVNADGSNLRRIDNRLPGLVFPLAWILGDTYISLWNGELYIFQVETGDYIRVTKIGEQLPESETLGIDISPNGGEFVILRRDQFGNRDEWLSIYDLETLERRDFSVKTANFAYPEWGS